MIILTKDNDGDDEDDANSNNSSCVALITKMS